MKISEEYETVTIRVPPAVRQEMKFAAKALNRPLWKLMVQSFQAYVGDGPPLADQKRDEYRFRRRQREKYGESEE